MFVDNLPQKISGRDLNFPTKIFADCVKELPQFIAEINNILSDREIKVLVLICKELSPIEISRRLEISEKTFFNHRANIATKIKAKSNIGLFKYAVRRGYAKI